MQAKRTKNNIAGGQEPCAAKCFCTVLGVCANERLFNILQFGKSLFLSNFAVTFAFCRGADLTT